MRRSVEDVIGVLGGLADPEREVNVVDSVRWLVNAGCLGWEGRGSDVM